MLDKIEKEAILNRWLLSNPPVLKTTVLKAQEDVSKLLDYISELENTSLVKIVLRLQGENEQLRELLDDLEDMAEHQEYSLDDMCYQIRGMIRHTLDEEEASNE